LTETLTGCKAAYHYLGAELISILREHPWLLILDGLERVLVAYNRYDAAQVRFKRRM
jgi:hypothetical protein